jgi:biopolymer transport protein ExbD
MSNKSKVANQEVEVPISAMIDIVFLLIIFFVVTATIDRDTVDEEIRLSHAPHGKLAPGDHRSVTINVRRNGVININGSQVGSAMIGVILSNAVSIWGEDIPIIVRGDANAPHGYIREVMKQIKSTGLYKVKLTAVINDQ